MMSTKLSRRAILTGATCTAAVIPALPLAATTGTHPDPIFAAIEVHRAALLQQIEKSWFFAGLDDDAPDYNAAEAEAGAARDVEAKIQMNLANIQPTTLGGVLALLRRRDLPWRRQTPA
jgi:hypothetical protein